MMPSLSPLRSGGARGRDQWGMFADDGARVLVALGSPGHTAWWRVADGTQEVAAWYPGNWNLVGPTNEDTYFWVDLVGADDTGFIGIAASREPHYLRADGLVGQAFTAAVSAESHELVTFLWEDFDSARGRLVVIPIDREDW